MAGQHRVLIRGLVVVLTVAIVGFEVWRAVGGTVPPCLNVYRAGRHRLFGYTWGWMYPREHDAIVAEQSQHEQIDPD